jgi:hypothetical protein
LGCASWRCPLTRENFILEFSRLNRPCTEANIGNGERADGKLLLVSKLIERLDAFSLQHIAKQGVSTVALGELGTIGLPQSLDFGVTALLRISPS